MTQIANSRDRTAAVLRIRPHLERENAPFAKPPSFKGVRCRNLIEYQSKERGFGYLADAVFTVDDVSAVVRRLRRNRPPIRPKPRISIAHTSGSGTSAGTPPLEPPLLEPPLLDPVPIVPPPGLPDEVPPVLVCAKVGVVPPVVV